MAFSGAPVVQRVTNNCFRISGGYIANGAIATIGFSDKTAAADVSIVAPGWQPYELDGQVSLADAVKVEINVNGGGAEPSPPQTIIPIKVTKTGTTHADFEVALENLDAANSSGTLEIYVTLAGR